MMENIIQRKRALAQLEHQIRQVYHHSQRPESLPPTLRNSLPSRKSGGGDAPRSDEPRVQLGPEHPEVPKYLRIISEQDVLADESELKALFANLPQVTPTPLFIRRTRSRLLKHLRVRKVA